MSDKGDVVLAWIDSIDGSIKTIQKDIKQIVEDKSDLAKKISEINSNEIDSDKILIEIIESSKFIDVITNNLELKKKLAPVFFKLILNHIIELINKYKVYALALGLGGSSFGGFQFYKFLEMIQGLINP